MAFGLNAKYFEKTELIPSGEYQAKIIGIRETTLNGENVLEVKLEIFGQQGKSPDVFRLFDVNTSQTREQQEWASKRISRFCDATGAKITQGGIDYQSIIGTTVKCEVGKRQNGYTDILRLLPISISKEKENVQNNTQMVIF